MKRSRSNDRSTARPAATRPARSGPQGRTATRGGQRAHIRALDENLATIKHWELAALHDRSAAEQLSDRVIRAAASGPILFLHMAWFGVWIAWNLGSIPGLTPFDPFPFPLLTTTVSLEAIFLTLFVLASQNRLAHQADKRAHLDLQIDLLAEREMTMVLRLLQDIARDQDVRVSVTPEQIRDLVKPTDVHDLTGRMEELPEDGQERSTPRHGDPDSGKNASARRTPDPGVDS